MTLPSMAKCHLQAVWLRGGGGGGVSNNCIFFFLSTKRAVRLQEHLPSSAGAAGTCCGSSAASPAGKQGTGATTLAGSRPSFPLAVPLGLQRPSDTRRTHIHRASKGKSCTTSQAGLSPHQGPLLRYLARNGSEVYSKMTIIMLKIKLDKTCFGSPPPRVQTHIKQTARHLSAPTVTYEAVLWLCFRSLNYTQPSQWKPASSISFRLAGLCAGLVESRGRKEGPGLQMVPPS